MRRPRWPVVRAILIALTITLGMIDSCMLPGSGPYKKQLFAPVQPIIDATRIAQKWALFDGSSREQFRMHLEIQRAPNTSWEPLFIAGDERYQAYAEQIHFRRVRGAWNPRRRKPTGAYDKFATWIMTKALADHPDAIAARLVMDRLRIGEYGGFYVVEEGLFPKVRKRGAIADHKTSPRPPTAPSRERDSDDSDDGM
jgi:hypothetical protein